MKNFTLFHTLHLPSLSLSFSLLPKFHLCSIKPEFVLNGLVCEFVLCLIAWRIFLLKYLTVERFDLLLKVLQKRKKTTSSSYKLLHSGATRHYFYYLLRVFSCMFGIIILLDDPFYVMRLSLLYYIFTLCIIFVLLI